MSEIPKVCTIIGSKKIDRIRQIYRKTFQCNVNGKLREWTFDGSETRITESIRQAIEDDNDNGYDPGSSPNRIDDRTASYGCLAPDTLIWMADGSKKAIAEIQQGDKVLSGADKNQVTVDDVAYVLKSDHNDRVLLELPDGTSIEMSGSQPLVSVAGPIPVSELFADAELVTLDDDQKTTKRTTFKLTKQIRAESSDVLLSLHTQSGMFFFAGESGLAMKCKGGPYGPPPRYLPK